MTTATKERATGAGTPTAPEGATAFLSSNADTSLPYGDSTSLSSKADGPRPNSADDHTGAARRVLRYLSWRIDNGPAYRYAESIAVALVRTGRRVSGNDLVERIRKANLVDHRGRPVRVNNDYAPLLVREIALRNPEVASHIEVRTHAYDGLLTMQTLTGVRA